MMRSNILVWKKTLSSLIQSRNYAVRSRQCDAHMNELPVPCQPWQPWYNDRQSFFNKHLAIGITWLAFSFIMAMYTESMYLNWSPPAQPSAPSDSVEECDDADS